MLTEEDPHRSVGGKLILTLNQKLARFLSEYYVAVAFGMIAISSLALLPALDIPIQGDVNLYQGVVRDLLSGTLPYRDRVFEYPPYVLPILLLPRLFGEDAYPTVFMGLALLVDWLMKFLLLKVALRNPDRLRSLLPLASYCLAVPFLRHFLLQRYDLWPALISLLAVWLFCSERYKLSGLCIAAGIGVKLYPVVFVPVLFVLAARQKKGRAFTTGLITGLLPMALLSFILPWWRFAQFHGARGLQCESIYASILWLGKHLELAELNWVFEKAWFEVQGPLASAILPWARILFAAAVVLSVAITTVAAARMPRPSAARVARLLLVPLLGFVAWNQVLSPQFLVWILPLAALASLEGNRWPVVLLVPATIMTPIIYPSWYGDYGTGLSLFETSVLVLRNLMLIGVWLSLVRELIPCVCQGVALDARPP